MTKTAWRKLKGAMGDFIQQANARDAVELMICGAICGMVSMVWAMRQDVATLSAKLETANPLAIAAKVETISQNQLTKEDVALVMAGDAWRRGIERELAELRATLKPTPMTWPGPQGEEWPWVLPGGSSASRPTGK